MASLNHRLHLHLRNFRGDFARFTDRFPEVAAALGALQELVDSQFPLDMRSRLRGRPRQHFKELNKSLRNRNCYLRRKLTSLRCELNALKKGKDKYQHNRMTPEFLVKVALSWPVTCARGFSEAFRDLVGVGAAGCSRGTISRIRDAFVEALKEFNGREVAAILSRGVALKPTPPSAAFAPSSAAFASNAGASALAAAALAPVTSVAVLHIHDEASLRLRSSADTDVRAPSRSRSSKVQQHAVCVQGPNTPALRWFCELHPLANKGAKVLATALHIVISDVAKQVGAALKSSTTAASAPEDTSAAGAPAPAPIWLMHVLVGDGVGTNEAAAKILLSWFQRSPLPDGLVYFVMNVKCANHQANLVVGSVVAGRAALVGTNVCSGFGSAPWHSRVDKHLSTSAANHVCGTIVRMFKYLVCALGTKPDMLLAPVWEHGPTCLVFFGRSVARSQHRSAWRRVVGCVSPSDSLAGLAFDCGASRGQRLLCRFLCELAGHCAEFVLRSCVCRSDAIGSALAEDVRSLRRQCHSARVATHSERRFARLGSHVSGCHRRRLVACFGRLGVLVGGPIAHLGCISACLGCLCAGACPSGPPPGTQRGCVRPLAGYSPTAHPRG